MTEMLAAAGGAVLAGIIFGAWKWIKKIFARVQASAPERRKSDHLEARLDRHGKALDALLDTQGPTLDGVIALLEVTKGTCNGNVDEALRNAREARTGFTDFIVSSAKVGGAS